MRAFYVSSKKNRLHSLEIFFFFPLVCTYVSNQKPTSTEVEHVHLNYVTAKVTEKEKLTAHFPQNGAVDRSHPTTFG